MRMPLVVAACLCASTATAQQPQCGPWAVIQGSLKERYKEVPIGGGVVNDGMVVTVLAAIDGKTFSILTVNKQGVACFIASGTDYDPGLLPRVEG